MAEKEPGKISLTFADINNITTGVAVLQEQVVDLLQKNIDLLTEIDNLRKQNIDLENHRNMFNSVCEIWDRPTPPSTPVNNRRNIMSPVNVA